MDIITHKTQPLFALVAATFGLGACFGGPGFLTQNGGSSNVQVETSETGDGVTTGQFKAGSTVAQTLSASSAAISGSSVSFPAGSLQVDTTIAIEQGASIAGSTTGVSLGL